MSRTDRAAVCQREGGMGSRSLSPCWMRPMYVDTSVRSRVSDISEYPPGVTFAQQQSEYSGNA